MVTLTTSHYIFALLNYFSCVRNICDPALRLWGYRVQNKEQRYGRGANKGL